MGELPIRVRARAIAEIYADDINSGSVPSYRACSLQIKELKHEPETNSWSSGTKGEAHIKIQIRPLGDSRPDSLRVRETRIVQSNAFPPLPTRAVDVFTSSV